MCGAETYAQNYNNSHGNHAVCIAYRFRFSSHVDFVWAAGASDLTTGAARKRQTAETVVRAGLGV